MTCDTFTERFDQLHADAPVDGLPDDVRRHLDGCPDCRQRLALDRLIRGRTRVPPPVPPRLGEKVWQALQDARVRIVCELLRNALVVTAVGAAVRHGRKLVARGPNDDASWS